MINLYLAFIYFAFTTLLVTKEFKCFRTKNLELLHIIYRHGDRTAESTYPNDPYVNETYYPFGPAQLTNLGKIKSYNTGVLFRQKYNSFIGFYTPKVIEVNTSPCFRCQATTQLILAGLFPPTDQQIWNPNLHWQPIPYTCLPKSENKLFWISEACSKFKFYLNKRTASKEYKEAFESYEKYITYLSENSGLPPDPLILGKTLYTVLKSQEEWGLVLPKWTDSVWPNIITEMSEIMWQEIFSTDELRTLGGGFLMSKIINDTYLVIKGDPSVRGRKINLYGGHDATLVAILSWVGVFKPHNPSYLAYIIIEIHNILGLRFICILYQNYYSDTAQYITIPNCGIYCPFEKFVSLYTKFMNPLPICN